MALRTISQTALAATTETSVVDGTQIQPIMLETVVFCNRGATNALVRLRLKVGNESDDDKQFLLYDIPVLATDSFEWPRESKRLGIQPGDVLKAYASTANVTVTLVGE